MTRSARYIIVFLGVFSTSAFIAPTTVQDPVVRAVLFYTPTCPHCHDVINDHLPGIFERFGGPASVFFDRSKPQGQNAFYEVTNGRLQILLVDASLPSGAAMYRDWATARAIPENRWSVPRLVIADSSLVGSNDIPGILPQLIEEGLAADGIDWPDMSGFEDALATIPPHAQPTPAGPLAEAATGDAVDIPTEEPSDSEEVAVQPSEAADESAGAAEPVAGESDDSPAETEEPVVSAPPETEEPVLSALAENPAPEGEHVTEEEEVSPPEAENAAPAAQTLAVIPSRTLTVAEKFNQDRVGNSFSVVVLLVMVLSLAALFALMRTSPSGEKLGIAVPVIAVIGAAVATYLTIVETSGVAAVCGPVGDCNTVNQSEYAMLFGFLPVGLLGLIGYIVILAAWVISRLDLGPTSDWAAFSVLAMAVFGTLFSIYLTFLEPFVIGATCIWCLSSAIAITLLMWLSARPAKEAWQRLSRAPE